jgi:two-component system sensor histidine kinase SenX3
VGPLGVVVAIIALVLGLCLGVLLSRRRGQGIPEVGSALDLPEPTVPDGASELLAVLPAAGIVVGPHDEVIEATPIARNLALVRGSRLAVPELLELARRVRQDRELREQDVVVPRGFRAASTFLSVRVAPLGDDLILVLAEDQTAALRVEQTRRDFVANISHELKTPIGAVSLLAEAVADAAEDPPAVRRFAGRLSLESARLSDLVSQIIDLTRLQADNPLDKPEVVELDEVLAAAVDRCRVDADRHQVSLTVAGTQGCRVLGNSRQLGLAMDNLVENAVIYSDPGARVVVAAHLQPRSDDDYVAITVSDTGIGIPPAEQSRIFERFYRVDYARSRANGGTGLGLAIVKHIVAAHGGEVEVWSQPGQGSTFTICIPAHLHDGAQAAAATGGEASAQDQVAAPPPTPIATTTRS